MGSRAVGPGEWVVDGVARIEALLRQALGRGAPLSWRTPSPVVGRWSRI